MTPVIPLAHALAPFIPSWGELRPFAAELWLVGTAVAVLWAAFFFRRPNSACGAAMLVGMCGALGSLLAVGVVPAGPRFAGMLAADGVAFFWKALLLTFTIGVVLMWFATNRTQTHEGDGPEFFTLLAGATFGMDLMGSAANLLMVYLAAEAASLPSYVLAGFRKTDRLGAEASLKYVLFGAAATGVMVYGLSLLYGLYGTLQLYPSVGHAGLVQLVGVKPVSPALLALGLLGVVAGLGFKVSAVPFHFWCPDVFEGAAIEVTTFLSVASKGAGLVLLLRVMSTFAGAAGGPAGGVVTGVVALVGVLGAITCTVGNLAAYPQTNVKRLLAYSSIAQAGYMLCALAVPPGRGEGSAGSQALLLYLAVYVFMNLGAFAVAGAVARATGEEDLAAFRGLGRRAPVLAACMAACLVSLVGLPPVAGFTAKVNLLWVLAQAGGWRWALVAAVVLNTVASLYYYARLLRAMYLEPGAESRLSVPRLAASLAAVCAVALVLLFLAWGPLDRVTRAFAGR